MGGRAAEVADAAAGRGGGGGGGRGAEVELAASEEVDERAADGFALRDTDGEADLLPDRVVVVVAAPPP